MTDLNSLAEKLSVLARSGVAVEAANGALLLKVVSRQPPETDLIVFAATPKVDDLSPYEQTIILAFNDFNDYVALLIDRTDLNNVVPMIVSQDIFNKAIFLNRHAWIDALRFKIQFQEMDAAKWRDA